MNTIDITPHHIIFIAERLATGEHVENTEHISFYYDEFMRKGIQATVEMIVTNRDLLVLIVSRKDSLCQFCPENTDGINKKIKKEPLICYPDNQPYEKDIHEATEFEFIHLINKEEPITARELIDLVMASENYQILANFLRNLKKVKSK